VKGDALDRLLGVVEDPETRLVPFVGSGVSYAVTEEDAHASWAGLLQSGIERCAVVLPGLPEDWGDRTRARLAGGDVMTYLNVADEVSLRLKGRGDGREFKAWIEATVGALHVKRPELIDAVGQLSDTLIVTTNYDTLLEDHLGRGGVTQHDKTFRASLGGLKPVIAHLHGVVRDHETVVLGSADYQRLADDAAQKALKDALFITHTFLFVGCGDGLRDRSVGPVLGFVDRVLEESEVEHYLLVRGTDLRSALETPIANSVVPIAYGAGYEQLAPFLAELATGKAPSPSQDPAYYEDQPSRRPRTGLLDLAAPSERALQLSLDVIQLSLRAMAQVERRGKAPEGIETWDYSDQAAVHQQLAAAVDQPIERLANDAARLVGALEEADEMAGQLWAERFAAHASQLEPLRALTGELDGLCAHLAARATGWESTLVERSERSDVYKPLRSKLQSAGMMLREAAELASSLHSGFERALEPSDS
jgi:hypothetical protein